MRATKGASDSCAVNACAGVWVRHLVRYDVVFCRHRPRGADGHGRARGVRVVHRLLHGTRVFQFPVAKNQRVLAYGRVAGSRGAHINAHSTRRGDGHGVPRGDWRGGWVGAEAGRVTETTTAHDCHDNLRLVVFVHVRVPGVPGDRPSGRFFSEPKHRTRRGDREPVRNPGHS